MPLLAANLADVETESADSKNWTVCSSNHALCDAAQHQMGQAATAVRAHDNQIGSDRLRLVEDSFEGRAVSDLGTDGHCSGIQTPDGRR